MEDGGGAFWSALTELDAVWMMVAGVTAAAMAPKTREPGCADANAAGSWFAVLMFWLASSRELLLPECAGDRDTGVTPKSTSAKSKHKRPSVFLL